MFYIRAMNHSATPILDLEIAPPRRRDEVSVKGLLKAIPAALAVVTIVPVSVLVRVLAERYLPDWTDLIFSSPYLSRMFNPLSKMELLPGLFAIWIGMWIAIALHESGHAVAGFIGGWNLREIRAVPLSLHNLGGKWQLKLCWKIWPAAMVLAEPKPHSLSFKVASVRFGGPSSEFPDLHTRYRHSSSL